MSRPSEIRAATGASPALASSPVARARAAKTLGASTVAAGCGGPAGVVSPPSVPPPPCEGSVVQAPSSAVQAARRSASSASTIAAKLSLGSSG